MLEIFQWAFADFEKMEQSAFEKMEKLKGNFHDFFYCLLIWFLVKIKTLLRDRYIGLIQNTKINSILYPKQSFKSSVQ